MMKKAKTRHVGSRLLSILLALVLVLTNFGGMFPGKAKADGESNEGKFAVSTKGIITYSDDSGNMSDQENPAVITAGAGSYGAGDKVTLVMNATCEQLPYIIDRVFYYDGVADHEITKDADGKYSFIMPESNVTVTAHVLRCKAWSDYENLPQNGIYYFANHTNNVIVNNDWELTKDAKIWMTSRVVIGGLKIPAMTTLTLYEDNENNFTFRIEAPTDGSHNVTVNGTLHLKGQSIIRFNVDGYKVLCDGSIILDALESGKEGPKISDCQQLDLVNNGSITIAAKGVSFDENSHIVFHDNGKLYVQEDLTGEIHVKREGTTPYVFTSGLKGHGDASNFVCDDPSFEVTLNDEGEAMLSSKKCEISVQVNLVGREWTDEDVFEFTLANALKPDHALQTIEVTKNSVNHTASFKKETLGNAETYSYVISQVVKGQKNMTYDTEDKIVDIKTKQDAYGNIVADEGYTLTPTVTFSNTNGYKVTTKGIVNRNTRGGNGDTEDVEINSIIIDGEGFYGAGDKVTLTMSDLSETLPHYFIDRVFYNDGTADHEITKGADGKYSFIMPENNVTVTAHVIEFELWSNPYSLPTKGNYYLTTGVSVDNWIFDSSENLNLCLNHEKIEVKENISIKEYATLNLFDNEAGGSSVSGKIEAYSIGMLKGTLNMYGGTIDPRLCNIEKEGQLCLINGHIDPVKTCDIRVVGGGKIDLAGGSITKTAIIIEDSEIKLSGTIFADTKTYIYLYKNDVINIAGKLPTDVKYAVVAEKYPHVITSGLQGNGDASNFVSDDPCIEVVLNDEGEAMLIKNKYSVTTKGIINQNIAGDEGNTKDVNSNAVITAGAGNYRAGDKVILTVDGTYEALPYLIDRVFYNDGTVDHEITKDADGKYSFTMPESNVTVTAHVIEFDIWDSSTSLPTKGNYYLTEGVSVDNWVINSDMNLCLNSQKVEVKDPIFIYYNTLLNLFDNESGGSTGNGEIEAYEIVIHGGTLNVYGGTIDSHNCKISQGQLCLINGHINPADCCYIEVKDGSKIDLAGGSITNADITVSGSEIKLSGTIFTDTKSCTIDLEKKAVINITGKLPTDAKYKVWADEYPYVITSGLKGNGDASNFVSYNSNCEVVLNENGEAEIISKRAEISVQANLVGREWTDKDAFEFTITPKGSAPEPEKTTVTIKKDSEDYTESFGKITFSDAGTYEYTISQKHKGETIEGVVYDAEDKTVTIAAEKMSDGTIVAASGSTLTPTVSFTNTYGYKVTTKGIINKNIIGGTEDVESDAVITAGAGYYGAGDKVTLTVDSRFEEAPNNSQPCYMIDRVFYNVGTADHEITKDADGEYSFTMPESNVTVTAHVIEFEPWDDPNSFPHHGNYYLDCNVDTTWCSIEEDLNLLLNGKSATITDNNVTIVEDITINLYDDETGTSTTDGKLIIEQFVKLNGTFNMYGGTLSINLAHAEIDGGRFNLFNGTIDLNGMHLRANKKGSINLVGGCVKEGVIRADNSVITLSGTTFEDASIDLKGTGIINIAGKLATGAEYKVSADKVPRVLTKGLKGNGDVSNFIPADSNYVVCLNANGEAVLDYDRTKYKLYVGGIQVTEGNCNNLATNHWSYDFENHVLTLNNYEFVGQGYAYDMRNGGKKGAVIYYEGEEDLTINLVGENVITPDGTDSSGDCGILSVNANATLNFTGDGSLFIESTGKVFAYYDTAIDAAGSIVVNSSGQFYAGNNDPNYGLRVGLGKTVTIGTNVKQFQAKGWTQGIYGTVKNEVEGTGYDQNNILSRLEVDTDGRNLEKYKKVTFPVGDYKLVFVPGKEGKPMGTGSMEEQEVFEGQSFEFPECEFDAPEGRGFAWWEMSGVDGIWMPGNKVVIANNCASDGIVYVMVNWGEKKPSEIISYPELNAFEFNSKAQELVKSGRGIGGKMNYALGEDDKTAPTTGWQEDVPEATFGGTYYVWYKVKGDSLHYDTEPKCIVVYLMHAAISASVGDQSAEYNGSEHQGSSEVTFTGLLDGHTAEIDYTPASGTLVGVYTGMFDKDSLKVVDADGNDMTDGYVLKSATPGKMTVTNRAKKYQINVTANSFVGPYDGEKHTVSGYKKEYTVDGNTYTVEGITASGASCKFVGIAYNVLSGTPVVRDAAGNDVTAQFDVSLPSGAVEIVKRDLVLEITSESKSFDYDGQKHFYNKYTVFEKPDYEVEGTEGKTEFDLYGDDKLRITPTASGVTNVGSYSENNTFTWQIDHADQYNLNVTCNYGTISVDPWKVTIAASDDEKTYDGTALTKDGFGTSGVKTGDTHIFAVTMTADSTITDCGTQANVIGTVDGVAVTTGVETAVGNYLITTVDGKLSIDPAPLTITAQSKELTYNGTAQGWSGYDVVGLFGADAITAVTGGTITFPSEGSVANKIDSYEFTTGKAGNYSVTKVDGVLTMKKASNAITITAASDEWTYDGKAHSNASVTVTSGTLFDGDTLVAEADGGPVTTVADSSLGNNPVAAGYKIMHGDEDVTANYVITCKSGTLSVKPKKVTITAKDASKEYDGSELTEGGFTVSALENGDVHEFTVEMTADSTVTGVGTKKNVIATVDGVAVMTGVETMVGNYFVTTADGELEVTASTKGLVITSSTKSWTYDGMNHVDNSYTVTYDGEEVAADATGRVFTLSTGDTVTIYPSAAGVKNVEFYDENNIFMYSLDNAANYANVSVICGTLSIEPKKVTIEADTTVKEYDGTPLTSSRFIVTALEDGDTHEFAVVMTDDSTITDYGRQANVIETVDGVAVTTGVETPVGNYLITTVDGELLIDPAFVTITAQSREFTYDGKAHDWSGYDVEGLIGNDKITAVTSGTITFPSEGSVANKIASYEFTSGDARNYVVRTVNGVLTMKNAAKAITITAADGEWTYDGKAHSNSGVTVTAGTLFDGDELVATAGGSVTNVRDNKPGNNPVAEYKIMHGTEDVTANYVVTCVAGTLTLTTTPVVITAQSKELTYNGTAQGWAGYDVEGLIGTDAITAVTSGTITFPSEGSIANKIASYEFTSGDALNYTVRTVDGALTMANAAREITITAASDAWTYDGTAHGNGGVTLTGGSLFPGDALVASANGSVKVVADTMQGNNPVAAGYKIMHGTQDVTASYVVTCVAGTLTVNPKALYVTADEKSRFHGHADPELTYVVTGLVEGDKMSGELTRESGEATGNYKILQGSLSAGNNYTIIFTSATFAIMPNVLYTQSLAEQLWNMIAAGGKQTVYWSEGDSLPYNIMKILQDHPQITLVFSYSYKGVNYRVTIPGSVAKTYPNIPWYGPLYLYGNYGMYNEDGSIKDGAVNPGVPSGIVDGTLRTYVIRRGDTLSRIARRLGTTVRRLVDLNHIKNPNRIYAGHELIYEAQE